MLYFVNFFKLYFFTRFFIDGLPPSVIEAIKSRTDFSPISPSSGDERITITPFLFRLNGQMYS